MSDERIRVFLLDDHEVVRRGLRDLFDAEPDMIVVGEAGTTTDAIAGIAETAPDVAILDVRLPDGDGVRVCREARARQPALRCLMLTAFADDDALFASILAGATGYLLKQVHGEDLIDGVRRVARGESLLDPAIINRVLDRLRQGPTDDTDGLSAQETRVFELVGEGLSNRQIGERMGLAEKTVKNYVSHVLGKLGMDRRSEAAALAARLAERRHPLVQSPTSPDGDPAGWGPVAQDLRL
jgi:two-component system, NarL family, response regulator DevR